MNILKKLIYLLFLASCYSNLVVASANKNSIFNSDALIKSTLNSKNNFVVLCYHNTGPTVDTDTFKVRIKELVEQFEYLKAHYNVVSLNDVIAANRGTKILPEKAVLITVDDGLQSFYDVYFPLIKLYQFPVVFAVVGKWMEEGYAEKYGQTYVKDPKMISWDQLKIVSQSNLVDVVSHSYNLHKGILFNPQGNEAPSAGYFKIDPISGKYETEEEFKKRIYDDLLKNKQLLTKKLGKAPPPVMVWPYGSFNGIGVEVAESLGLKINFSVQEGVNKASTLRYIHRGMIMSHLKIHDFADTLERSFIDTLPIRGLSMNLDNYFDTNPSIANKNLSLLLERVKYLGVNSVFINANNKNMAPLFPTKNSAGDFLGRVTHTITNKTRALNVFAKIQFPRESNEGVTYFRDLAKHTDLAGVVLVFNSEKPLNDNELNNLSESVRVMKKMRPFWKIGFEINRIYLERDQKLMRVKVENPFYVVKISNKTDLNSLNIAENQLNYVIEINSSEEELGELSKQSLLNDFVNFSYNSNDLLPSEKLRSIISSVQNPFELIQGEIK